MQMLFQADVGQQTPDEVRKIFWKARDEVDEGARGFAEDLFRVATEREAEIDALIERNSKNWRLNRMPAVDRNLLRMAVAELLGFRGTPAPIVIDEALEIARRYAAPESIDCAASAPWPCAPSHSRVINTARAASALAGATSTSWSAAAMTLATAAAPGSASVSG